MSLVLALTLALAHVPERLMNHLEPERLMNYPEYMFLLFFTGRKNRIFLAVLTQFLDFRSKIRDFRCKIQDIRSKTYQAEPQNSETPDLILTIAIFTSKNQLKIN